MKPLRLCILLWLCLGLAACTEPVVLPGKVERYDDYVARVLGLPVGHFIARQELEYGYASQTGWVRQTCQLDNGHQVYVYPATPDCLGHWEVSREDIIVGHRAEGECPCLSSEQGHEAGGPAPAGGAAEVAIRRTPAYRDWVAGLAELSERFYWYYVPRCD